MSRKQIDATPDQYSATADLIDLVSVATGYNKVAVTKVIKAFHQAICDELSRGQKSISIRPFYKVEVVDHGPIKVMNHDTGKMGVQEGRQRIRMIPFQEFRATIGQDTKYARKKKINKEHLEMMRERRAAKKAALPKPD